MNEILNSDIFIKNEYYYKYIELISNNINTNFEKYKTQKHHIIPRKFYYFLKKEVDNTASNLVYLLYKDHILAHYYLALCTDGVYRKVNEEALLFLINQKLEEIDINELNHYQELYEDLCRRKSDVLLGTNRSDEVKRKISESTKGKIFSDETKNKISLALSGDNNPMKREDVRLKSSLSHKGQIPWSKGKKLSDETKLKISQSKSGENHPNWGKHLSEETRNKISVAHKGKIISEETKIKISEANKLASKINPNYGMKNKHHSEETKLKLKQTHENRVWYTNGIEELHLKIDDIVPEGFYLGRCKAVPENGIHNKGKICYNNGIEQIYILEEDIEKYVSMGYKKGGLPRKRKLK